MSRKVYEIIQERFANAIQDVIDGKEELLPWQKPWKGSKPINYVTRRPYSGVNLLLLDGGEYLTFNQFKKLQKKDPSLEIIKGSKKHFVIFWKIVEKENEEGEIETFPLLRYYYVYHQSAIKNLKSKLPKGKNHQLIDEAEEIIENYVEKEGIEIKTIEGGNKACYQPKNDLIKIPDKSQFNQIGGYYSTLFHELSHSTGHENRLNRFTKGSFDFGSEVYSKEELIAEISSQMILGALNMKNMAIEENSISYLYGWMNAIKEDASLIISASKHAEIAADYILELNN